MRTHYYRSLHRTCCALLHVYVRGLRIVRRVTRQPRGPYPLHSGLVGED